MTRLSFRLCSIVCATASLALAACASPAPTNPSPTPTTSAAASTGESSTLSATDVGVTKDSILLGGTVGYLKDPADPVQASDRGMQLYKQIMARYYPDGAAQDSLNVWGMAAAWSMVDVLKKAGPNLTRQTVMDVVNNLTETDNPFLYPGISIKNTPTDHYTITQELMEKYDATANDYSAMSKPIDVRGKITFP